MKKWQKAVVVGIIYISGIPFAYKMTRNEFRNLDGRTCIPGGMTSWGGGRANAPYLTLVFKEGDTLTKRLSHPSIEP